MRTCKWSIQSLLPIQKKGRIFFKIFGSRVNFDKKVGRNQNTAKYYNKARKMGTDDR